MEMNNLSTQPTSEVRKFTGDTLWLSLALGTQMLLGFIVLPIMTKVFPTELYGVWTQILATMVIISTITIMGLDITYIKFLGGVQEKEQIRDALGTVFWPVFTVGCLLCICSFFGQSSLSSVIFGDPKFAHFIPPIFFWSLGQALFLLSYSYYKATLEIKRVAIIQIISNGCQNIAIYVLAIIGVDLIWIVISCVIVQFVFTAINLLGIIAKVGLPSAHIRGLKKYLLFGIPLLPSSLLLWILSSIDRFFVTNILGVSQAGIYSVSRSLANLCAFFLTPIAYNMFYTISGLWKKGEINRVKSYFEHSVKLFLTMAIPAAVGLAIISPSLLKILTTTEYVIPWELVLMLTLGVLFMGIYQINVYVILLIEQTKWLPLIMLIAAATNVGMNTILIPRIGINGAAISNIVSFFIQAVIVTFWARIAISYRFDFKYVGKIIFATLLLAVYLWFVKIDSIIGIILVIIGGVALYIIAFLLMKPFSIQDKEIIKDVGGGIISKLRFYKRFKTIHK